jgi:hypothetical protein
VNFEAKDGDMGLIKSVRQSSYLFGLIASETIIEFYPIEAKGGKNGRDKK